MSGRLRMGPLDRRQFLSTILKLSGALLVSSAYGQILPTMVRGAVAVHEIGMAAPGISNAWKPLKVGAGGWLTGLDIAPDGTMAVRTDTYGAYLWNGSKWQQLVNATSMPPAEVTPGVPDNEGVYEIRVAPGNTNIFYMQYRGNIYRSTDKGTTWIKTAFAHVLSDPNDGHRIDGQKMAVDPSNPNIVYAGTQQNGLFVTKDGGASWTHVSSIPNGSVDASGLHPGITGIAFDPTSGVTRGATNVIYASSYGSGVYKSSNGGASWTATSGSPSSVQFATVSRTGAYYAIGNNNTALWRYQNNTWTQPIQDSSQGIQTVAVDPFNTSHLVICTQGGNLRASLNGGATWSDWNWTHQASATDIPWLSTTEAYKSIGGMQFDPLLPGKLWASAGVGVWNTNVPQIIEWNTPIVWNSQNVGIEQLVANDIVVALGGKPVLASWDRSFFYISNPEVYPSIYGVAGKNRFSAGWSVDYASSNPDFIVGISDWWGEEQSGYSTDGGQHWHVFPSFPAFAGQTIGGTIAASSPMNFAWAPANGHQPYYTKDGGANWKPVNLPGVSDWSVFHWAYYLDKRTVTADRVHPNTFYMYYVGKTNSGVYKTTDGGTTWAKVFNGEISRFSTYNSRIEAVPGQAGHLFFTGGPQGGKGDNHPADQAFYRSTNGGVTWTAVPNVLEAKAFGYGAPATLGGYPSVYVVGWIKNVYGIWQSNDNAQSWTQLGVWPEGSLDEIKTISGDPNVYGQVYIGFAGSGYAYLPTAPVAVPGGPRRP
jgi:hypothetical protein